MTSDLGNVQHGEEICPEGRGEDHVMLDQNSNILGKREEEIGVKTKGVKAPERRRRY